LTKLSTEPYLDEADAVGNCARATFLTAKSTEPFKLQGGKVYVQSSEIRADAKVGHRRRTGRQIIQDDDGA
jgi:hypothetical protein